MKKFSSILSMILTAVFISGVIQFISPPALAADVEVSTFLQLRTAIYNASGPTNVIVCGDIAFTDTVIISIGKNITIRSSEDNQYILTVTGFFRHFYVGAEELVIENITIDGGNPSSDAICGGIDNSGKLILSTGAVITACIGSGIYNQGTVNINGGKICGNTAANGGGIENSGGTVNLIDGEISGNTAQSIYGGGGIYNRAGGTVNVSGGAVSGNKAGIGGGISSGSHLSTIITNTVNISGGEISGNTTMYGYGGGINNYDNSALNISGGKISGNRAGLDGGGITNGGALTVTGGEISGNTAKWYGGGIWSSGTVTVADGEISGNTANFGGGIWTDDLTKVTVSNTVFSGNTASQAYWMTDEADIVLHNKQITGTTLLSAPPSGHKPFEYAYNNYDISYSKGLTGNPLEAPTLTGAVTSYNPNIPATVQLLRDGKEAYKTTTATTPGSGQTAQPFTFDNVAPGDYTLVVTKPGHASYTIQTVAVGDEDVDLSGTRGGPGVMTLPCGDINGDGVINDNDLIILWQAVNYNKVVGDAANPLCDLNGDGMINDNDLIILWQAVNYNKGPVVVG